MKEKSLGLVAAELFVMYSHDPAIKARVDGSNEPYNELMSIGYELGVHDIPAEDGARNTDLAYLIEPLMIADGVCLGQ